MSTCASLFSSELLLDISFLVGPKLLICPVKIVYDTADSIGNYVHPRLRCKITGSALILLEPTLSMCPVRSSMISSMGTAGYRRSNFHQDLCGSKSNGSAFQIWLEPKISAVFPMCPVKIVQDCMERAGCRGSNFHLRPECNNYYLNLFYKFCLSQHNP